MNKKLGLVVPIVFLLLQLTTSQNATQTDNNDGATDNSMTDDSSGPPPFGDGPPGPPGPPPDDQWRRHGPHRFGRQGPCGPPPPFATKSNHTNTNGSDTAKRSIRQRRDPPMNGEEMGNMGDSMMSQGQGQGQENGNQDGPPQRGGGGRGGDGREPPRGFFRQRPVRHRRDVPQSNDEAMGDTMSQGQGGGRQGGPPRHGDGGGNGPPRGIVGRRSVKERRDAPPMNEDGTNDDPMRQNPENDGGERRPAMNGRMRRCNGRSRTTTMIAPTTTAAAGENR